MTNQRRLGRGLEALLGRPADEAGGGEFESQWGRDAVAVSNQSEVDVHQIDSNPFQPRRDFDDAATSELAESIREHGILQPLVVRRMGDRFQLVAGERRLRAATLAGLAAVPVHVREADDRQMAELAIVENLQRKDLGPLEKAASFQDYLARYGCTQEELAGRLKIDRSTVANMIRLLELPPGVQQSLRSGAITAGHARALLPLGDEREQLAACRRIEEEALSVRATEQLVGDIIHHADDEPLAVVGAGEESIEQPGKRSPRARGGQLVALEGELRAALGIKVDLRQTASGRGRIVVHFASGEEFERLRQQITGTAAHSHVG